MQEVTQQLKFDYLSERYRELCSLGSRQPPSTFLARDSVSGQIVVKKYVPAENGILYEQLMEISHPNLVRIFHVAAGRRAALVIMEYISGCSLEDLLRESGYFSEEQTIDYICQLLRGLDEIHRRNIVHRDINPKNLLVSTDGVLKILDFDIGRLYRKGQGYDTTILGTPGFAAPEQFGGGQSDQRADIYSVGILINVMLTGVFPRIQTWQRGKLGEIIRICTQIGPEKRYQTVSPILAGLKSRGRDRSIWPGFRTGTPRRRALALCYYAFMPFLSLLRVLECARTPQTMILELIAVIMQLWLTVFLPFNFLHWMDKVPVIRRLGKNGHIVLGIFLWLLFFYYGAILDEYVRINLLHFPSTSYSPSFD